MDTPSSDAAVRIRAATRADLPAIVALLADDQLGAAREEASDPLPASYMKAFDAMEAQPGNELYVATIDHQVVGCLQLIVVPGLSYRGATHAQIEGVRVSSAYRNRGIGEQIVRMSIDRARALGCSMMQLSTNLSRRDAHRFYERLGFKATHAGMKLSIAP
jgi:ribosomal protein S18 acetylase RimI-like enzyme